MVQKTKLTLMFASFMMLGLSIAFTSCSEEDNVTKEPTLEVVKGDYSGKMNVVSPTPKMTIMEAAESEGVNVNATVKNDTLYFEDFPVKDIVELIVPEEQVGVIVEAAGKVSYKIGYKAAFNGVKDSIKMELSPKPLVLSVSLDDDTKLSIKTDISVADKGTYSIKEKKLTLTIKADKVTVNDEAVEEFVKPSISFSLNKK